jgi:hypothetical protein
MADRRSGRRKRAADGDFRSRLVLGSPPPPPLPHPRLSPFPTPLGEAVFASPGGWSRDLGHVGQSPLSSLRGRQRRLRAHESRGWLANVNRCCRECGTGDEVHQPLVVHLPRPPPRRPSLRRPGLPSAMLRCYKDPPTHPRLIHLAIWLKTRLAALIGASSAQPFVIYYFPPTFQLLDFTQSKS